jgi:hypothetical protein
MNDELQDQQLNFITPSNVSGNLTNKDRVKLTIKANLSGFFTVSCRLFIDDRKVELRQTK